MRRKDVIRMARGGQRISDVNVNRQGYIVGFRHPFRRHRLERARAKRLQSESRAFSSEVDTGSREENASKQESRASVLIQSEPIVL
jgi:hypothetical protein